MSSRFDLSGRVAIVTGAGAGIGRRIARGLAGEGATVVVADLNRAAASTVALEIEAEGGSGAAIEANVTDPGDVARLVDETVARFGTVDILVNNAGGGKGYGATVDLSERVTDRVRPRDRPVPAPDEVVGAARGVERQIPARVEVAVDLHAGDLAHVRESRADRVGQHGPQGPEVGRPRAHRTDHSSTSPPRSTSRKP